MEYTVFYSSIKKLDLASWSRRDGEWGDHVTLQAAADYVG